MSGRSCSAARSVFFRTQLETLERLTDHRQTHRHARSLGQALAVLTQQRVIVLSHELAQHRKSVRVQPGWHAATVRLGLAPIFLTRLTAPVRDRCGTDLEAVRNLDLRSVAPLTSDQNTLLKISEIGLGHGSPPLPYASQRAAHPNGFTPSSRAL
jgi:hypothetical protein